MTVRPFPAAGELDLPQTSAPLGAPSAGASPASGAAAFAGAVGDAFGQASAALTRADAAESAFATGRGGMQEMVIERAQADIALSVASAAASRAAQSLTTILGMQI